MAQYSGISLVPLNNKFTYSIKYKKQSLLYSHKNTLQNHVIINLKREYGNLFLYLHSYELYVKQICEIIFYYKTNDINVDFVQIFYTYLVIMSQKR